MAEIEKPDTPKNVVDDFVTYIRNKYKEHFITEFDGMYGKIEGPKAGFNMVVKSDGTVVADRLYLKPESQKKGIGTEIMQEMFEWSNKNNQPFEFVLMAGYDDLSSPSRTVKIQKAFQEKLKNITGLEAIPSDQGLMGTKITTYKYTPQDTPTNVVDDYINALKQEASKYKTFDEYEKAFSREYKRGIYYHLTDNPNFVVDLSKGATDAATGKMTPGSIMFTTDLDYWADTTWTDRPYVAILDLSDVDESQFTQVNRGQGNEFYLDDASKVKVKEVIPVDEALKQSELINQWGLDNLKNKEDLKNVIWDNRLDTPGSSLGAAKLNDPLVFDSWIDNYAKTTTSFIDNLPLSTTVKNQFNNLVKGRAKNLATPGGVADAVDVWELGVLGLMIAAVAYKEYDEIPTILTNKAIDMFNNMTSFYNIPPVPKEEYNLDYEFINKVVETGEKFMPTDIIIKKVGEVVKGAAETGTVTGFGYVPTTTEKADTMEKTQRIQPGVQEEKMFEQAKPKKIKPTGGAGAKIL